MKARRVAAFLALSASWSLAQAQSFPGKPIRVIVPSIAGRPPDVRVRQIAPKLSETVGQPVIVHNRPGANGAIAAQVTAVYLVPNAIAPHVRAGKLRALAVAGPARVPVFRDVPTMAEAGLPGVEASVWNGYFVPAGTPQPIIQVLNRELLRTFSAPEVREQVAATGGEIVGGRPEEFAAFIRSEIAKWGKVIADAGIKLQ